MGTKKPIGRRILINVGFKEYSRSDDDVINGAIVGNSKGVFDGTDVVFGIIFECMLDGSAVSCGIDSEGGMDVVFGITFEDMLDGSAVSCGIKFEDVFAGTAVDSLVGSLVGCLVCSIVGYLVGRLVGVLVKVVRLEVK